MRTIAFTGRGGIANYYRMRNDIIYIYICLYRKNQRVHQRVWVAPTEEAIAGGITFSTMHGCNSRTPYDP